MGRLGSITLALAVIRRPIWMYVCMYVCMYLRKCNGHMWIARVLLNERWSVWSAASLQGYERGSNFMGSFLAEPCLDGKASACVGGQSMALYEFMHLCMYSCMYQ